MKKSHFLMGIIVLLVGASLTFRTDITRVSADTEVSSTISVSSDTTSTPDVTDLTITSPVTTDSNTQTSDTDQTSITTPATITLEATSIVCDTNDASPHWGNGAPAIDGSTAASYVANSDGHCQFAPNWNFQWSDQSTNPLDISQTETGPASGFTSFGPTDANGSTTTVVLFPPTTTQFHVREDLQTGYIPFTFDERVRSNANSDSAEFYCQTDGLNYDNFEYIRNSIAGDTYHCIGFNVSTAPVTTPSGGTQTTTVPPVVVSGGGDTETPATSGGGTSGGSGGITFNPTQGQVLGASTTSGGSGSGSQPQGEVLGASTSCGEYITSYINLGAKNDPQNVTNLQAFLNYFIHTSLPIDGVYGSQTFAAVKQFQVLETDQVLLPWKNLGNPNLVGTGYVYKTTKREINNIVCPSLNLPMPMLP